MTRVRPRPVVPSGSDAASVGPWSGRRSPRASLTSMRRRPHGRVEDEREPEAAAGHAAVQDGVGGKLRDDELGTLREVWRGISGAQLGHREQPGEAGTPPRGRQQLREGVHGRADARCCVVHGARVAVRRVRMRVLRRVREQAYGRGRRAVRQSLARLREGRVKGAQGSSH